MGHSQIEARTNDPRQGDDSTNFARLLLLACINESFAEMRRRNASISEQRAFKITIDAKGALVITGFPDLEAPPSLSVKPIAEQASTTIAELTELAPGWDGYNGIPVHPQVAEHARSFLEAIGEYTQLMPDVVPLSDGGMQLEWFVGVYEVEVAIAPDLATQIFFECTRDGRSEEIPLGVSLDVSRIAPFFRELRR